MTYGLHDPEIHGKRGAMCTNCDWWGTRWALWHDFRASIGKPEPIALPPTDSETKER